MSTTGSEGRRSGASKQTSSRRTTTRSASSSSSASSASSTPDRSSRSRETSAPDRAASLATVVRGAREQFAELIGRQPDSVTGARRNEDGDGWSVLVDVVELERIPDSTSVLATYRVDVDASGELTSYERLRRYSRGATDQR